MKRISLVGKRFGRLLVIEDAPSRPSTNGKRAQSLVHCDCGRKKVVGNAELKAGSTTSCGCYWRKCHITHGHQCGFKKTRIYCAWDGMMQRCTNSNHKHFHRYGGRGIRVCEFWKKFENFVSEMGIGKKGWSIHRIDNDAGYFLENCVWATHGFQMSHTCRSRIYTVMGYTDCLKNLCMRFAISYGTVQYRLRKGLSIEDAFFKPTVRALEEAKESRCDSCSVG